MSASQLGRVRTVFRPNHSSIQPLLNRSLIPALILITCRLGILGHGAKSRQTAHTVPSNQPTPAKPLLLRGLAQRTRTYADRNNDPMLGSTDGSCPKLPWASGCLHLRIRNPAGSYPGTAAPASWVAPSLVARTTSTCFPTVSGPPLFWRARMLRMRTRTRTRTEALTEMPRPRDRIASSI